MTQTPFATARGDLMPIQPGDLPPGVAVNTRNAKTGAYTVVNTDAGSTIALGGNAFYTLTFGPPSGYSANFLVIVLNEDTGRAKTIALSGGPTFFLYPGQAIIVFNQNNVWQTLGRGRWKVPGGTTNIFTDFVNGSDTNDGFAAGTGNAKKTVQAALDSICNDFDFTGYAGVSGEPSGPTLVVVNMVASTTDTNGVHFSMHDGPPGAQGHAAIKILGGSGAAITATGTDALACFDNTTLEISNVTLSTITSGNCILVDTGANVRIESGVTFGVCAGVHLFANNGGRIFVDSGYTISGSASFHLLTQNVALLSLTSTQTITITNNLAFTTFADAANSGGIVFPGATFSLGANTVTGKRFEADNLSIISTNGGGANYFPGNAAGTTSGGGVYV